MEVALQYKLVYCLQYLHYLHCLHCLYCLHCSNAHTVYTVYTVYINQTVLHYLNTCPHANIYCFEVRALLEQDQGASVQKTVWTV